MAKHWTMQEAEQAQALREKRKALRSEIRTSALKAFLSKLFCRLFGINRKIPHAERL